MVIGMKGRKFIAVLMIVLILSLPGVFAFQIGGYRVYGKDNVENYIRDSDKVKVVADIIDASGIDASKLTSLLRVGEFPFSSCQATPSGFSCSYSQDIQANGMKIFPYVVKLFDQWDNKADEKSGTFYVDNEAPTISIMNVRQSGDNIIIDLNARDKAYSASATNVCSGLNDITISKQGGGTLSIVNASGCEVMKTVRFPASGLGESGQHIICASVKDAFNQNASACTTVAVDLDKPMIGVATLKSEFTEQTLQYIGSTENGMFEFTVNESALESVEASIAGVNVPVTCTMPSTAIHNCISNILELTPGEFTLTITATDASENVRVKTQGFQLMRDTTFPLLDSLSTLVNVNGTSYISEHTKITARITETESGFYKNNVYLKFPTNEVVHADKCTKSTQWECTWENFSLGGLNGDQLFLLVDTYDDAMNAITSPGEYTMMIADTSPPNVFSEKVYALAEGFEVPFAYSNAPLFVSVNYTDASPISGVVDFSKLGGAIMPGDCADGSCQFESGALGEGPAVQNIAINLTDALGNTLVYKIEVELLNVVNDTPSYWQNEVTIMPGSLDRGAAEIINNFVYAEVILSSPANAELVGIDFDDCHSTPMSGAQQVAQGANVNPDGGVLERDPSPTESGIDRRSVSEAFVGGDSSDIQFIRDYEFIDSGTPNSLAQFIKLTLKATSYEDVDELRITCGMRLSSRVGSTFIPEEIETVDIVISFFANPAGNLGEAYEQELADAIDDATEGILNKIAALEEFVEIARKICTIVQGIQSILQSLATIISVFDGAADGALSTVIGSFAGLALKEEDGVICLEEVETQTLMTSIWSITSGFCDFITCRFSLSGWLWNSLTPGEEGKGSWFHDLQKNLQDYSGGAFVDYFQRNPGGTTMKDGGGNAYSNTEESLFWSIINLCIPGIIKNLNEYRQIQCRYALCLKNDVPSGVPKEACSSMKSYMTCKYIYGEIFAAIPIFAFFDQIMGQIRSIFMTPTGMLSIMGLFCAPVVGCGQIAAPVIGSGIAPRACDIYKLVKSLAEIVSNVMRIADKDTWNIEGEDLCEQLEDEDEDEDE
jgi:hypothetical protein